MPRFSANISTLFGEYEFLDRFQEAKNASFGAVEIQFPYDYDLDLLQSKKEEAEVDLVLFNIGAGDLSYGGAGIAAHPKRQDQFKLAVDEAYKYAECLRPFYVNILSGCPPCEDYGRDLCSDVLSKNLKYAAEIFLELEVKVLTEAVNTEDRPGFFLSTTSQSIEVIENAGVDNLAIQYDIYHMHIMEGNLKETIRENIDKIGHIQFADSPGRHEPGTGEINFPKLFCDLDNMGWNGWLGAEYVPSKDTKDTLAWMPE